MDRSRRLTDGTRWRTFMRLLRLDDMMTSYTNARPGAGLAGTRSPHRWSLMPSESRGQSCLQMDWFSGDGVAELQKLGVQKISSIAGKAREIFKRLAG